MKELLKTIVFTMLGSIVIAAYIYLFIISFSLGYIVSVLLVLGYLFQLAVRAYIDYKS
jgi:hypothetical protein